jgi:hypothetical protein
MVIKHRNYCGLPRSRQSSKILGRNDAEIIRYRMIISTPLSRHLLAQKLGIGVLKSAKLIMPVAFTAATSIMRSKRSRTICKRRRPSRKIPETTYGIVGKEPKHWRLAAGGCGCGAGHGTCFAVAGRVATIVRRGTWNSAERPSCLGAAIAGVVPNVSRNAAPNAGTLA